MPLHEVLGSTPVDLPNSIPGDSRFTESGNLLRSPMSCTLGPVVRLRQPHAQHVSYFERIPPTPANLTLPEHTVLERKRHRRSAPTRDSRPSYHQQSVYGASEQFGLELLQVCSAIP